MHSNGEHKGRTGKPGFPWQLTAEAVWLHVHVTLCHATHFTNNIILFSLLCTQHTVVSPLNVSQEQRCTIHREQWPAFYTFSSGRATILHVQSRGTLLSRQLEAQPLQKGRFGDEPLNLRYLHYRTSSSISNFARCTVLRSILNKIKARKAPTLLKTHISPLAVGRGTPWPL